MILEPTFSKGKIKGEIVFVLFTDHVKHLKMTNQWYVSGHFFFLAVLTGASRPTEFEDKLIESKEVDKMENLEEGVQEETQEDDDDLFVNTNRRYCEDSD